MEVIFRKFNQDDFQQLAAMVLGLYTKDATRNSHMTVEKVKQTTEKMSSANSSGQIFIFEHDSQTIGYSIVNRFWSNEFSGEISYIDELFVKPNFRNLGISTQFFEFLENEHGNNAVAFMLETVHTNEKAIKFYQKIGFKTHHNHMMFKRLA